MAGYVKMFQSILDSTIWKQPAAITKVWLTMMAMADRDGIVTAAIPGLADRAHVSIATAEKALGLFLAPDPYSKTPDYEGRRIEVMRGGWRLLNYEMHREMMSADDQRTKNADRQQRWRDRQRNGVVTLRNGECDNTDSESGSPSAPSRGSALGQTGAQSNGGSIGSNEPRFRDGPLTGNDLQRVFGQVRCKRVGGLPWQSVRVVGGAASSMADTVNENPEMRDDVIPTMELLFDRAKSGKAGKRSADILREPSFAFGAWCSQWTALREELHGLSPAIPVAAQPIAPGTKPWLEADKAREAAASHARMEGRRVLAELAAAEKAAEQTAAGGAR